MNIQSLSAKTIKDSRGKPTIQIFVNGCSGAAPSGTSKSQFEAVDYPISPEASAKFVNTKIKSLLEGFRFESFSDFKRLEAMLPKLTGGNPTIALEFAILQAWAKDEKKQIWELLNPKAKTMPRILANVVGGGAHSRNSIDIQEILISPQTDSFAHDVNNARIIHAILGKRLRARNTTLENAWSTRQPLHKVLQLISEECVQSQIGCDFAASNMFAHNEYHWRDFGALRAPKQLEILSQLSYEFGLFYLEDPFQEKAFLDFAKLLKKQKYALICGDDLTATNLGRLKIAITDRSINSIIVKPNQAGSLVKTKEVFDFAVSKGITPVISHRSGETLDTTIAQLAFAWQSPFVKFGIAGKERLAKLNELIKIEKSL